MISIFDSEGTVEHFSEKIREMLLIKSVQSILILACDKNEYRKEEIDIILKQIDVPVFGGIFPEIIYKNKKFSKGTIFLGLATKAEVYTIPQLSDSTINYEKVIDEIIPDTGNAKTMMVFVDGLSRRINALIQSLFTIFGSDFNYIGGGAGSLSFQQKPCLFSNEGLIVDSALIVLLDILSGIGVSHGWEKIEGPYRVTGVDKNVIKTLNNLPAFEVYRKVVEKHSGKIFSKENFFELAKCYPYGINKLNSESIVRDPLMLGENDSMICVGELSVESFVDILTGKPESLIDAASKATKLAKNDLKVDAKLIFFVDCISRVLFLEEEFSKEIDAVYNEDILMIGILTLGEIANSGKDYLEFYNKTAVVGAFP